MDLLRGFAGAHGTYREEEENTSKRKREIKKTARTRHEPVTLELWQQHLSGDYHLGIITITEENTCWWAVVDIDDYALDHRELVSRLAGMRVPAIVCRTKSGGAHVYLFFAEPIPASEVMPKMRELSAALGYGGSEVFPKQTEVVADQRGLGNWLNMPYFAGDRTTSYAYSQTGQGLSPEQFLDQAERLRLDLRSFRKLTFQVSVAGWEEAPPCLEHLAGIGVAQGVQNNALFSFGVLAKKRSPEGWVELLHRWNETLFRPPHPMDRVASVVKSLEKRDYNYKCKDQPCVSYCNMVLCRSREYGIGPGGGADIIDSVRVLATEPPIFYVLLKTGGTVECTSESVLNPRSFQKCTLEQTTTVLPLYKLETWLPQVQKAIENATIVDAPAEVGTTGQLAELIERFCTDRHAGEQRDDLLLGKPWRDEETGRVWFRLRDLVEFLERNRFRLLARGQITERIKNMSGGPDFFNIRKKGVNVWYVPMSQFTWQDGDADLPDSPEQPV